MPIPEPAHRSESARELVRDRVYAQLRNAILTGVLLPGERLDEAELRKWLQVSGTPIRQALQTLSMEGLVHTAPQSYSAVITPRPEHALETLQTIGVLLAGATLMTLPRLDDSARAELARLADAVIDSLRVGDVPAITSAAEAFFTLILHACPNPVLVEIIARSGPSLSYHVSVAHQGLDADLVELARGYETLRTALELHDDRGVVAATKRVFRVDHATS
ncbi:GntR family transcriptional regulator [Diaminobutyricibacter tongyongensis]|uniref:GntR family transcriptional regulator n=1 Tax=Leifsonia tongyongensis TaxID=1268043 RepID=A0A6L9XTI2_9MICO|nr:GntR family transcriptional regulator [Diaminobutyricibacter tongyongensis]NEN04699.1 GntR family transcriptional regulator [Diaminobutyricibacter tongyongensis]